MTAYIPTTGQYFHLKRSANSRNLLVIFSHLGARPPKFGWFKTFDCLNENLLFVNCAGREWYRNGINGLGDDGIAGTVSAILSIARSIDEDCEIFTLGGSMGGYGAILYGALVEAKAILACGCETVLRIPGGRSGVLSSDEFSHVYSDLRQLKKLPMPVFMPYGEMDLVDTLCAGTMLEFDSVRAYSVARGEHDVSRTLNERGELVSAAKAMIEGRRDVLDTQKYSIGLATESAIPSSWRLNSTMNSGRFDLALPLAKNFHRRNMDHPLPIFLLATVHSRLHQNDDASALLYNLLDILPDFPPALSALAAISLRRNELDKAELLMNRSIELDPSPSMSHFGLAMIHEKRGRFDLALQCVSRAIEINPTHKRYKEMLEKMQKMVP